MIKYKKLFVLLIFACLYILFILWFNYYNRKINGQITVYLKSIDKIEREYLENIPIYEDYITPSGEKELRKYLIKKHLEIAIKNGIHPVSDENEITSLAAAGTLVKLRSGPDELYYFYNVPDRFRFLRSNTVSGLETLTKRFQENIQKRKALPSVKIAISSAIRPETYQKSLLKKNTNAVIMSSHKYGISFDIFYDDFYISLPEPDTGNETVKNIIAKLRIKLGFMLGDSLRRQFRSILAETLLQLQEEKILYVIHEKNQRCYHVTILL